MPRPLRFAMVTTFYPPYNFGGDGIYVHRLANELAERGHRVDVVHGPDAYEMLHAGGPAADPGNHPNVTVHALRPPGGPLAPLITQQTGRPGLQAPALRRILDGGEFDVVHFHNVSLIGGPGVLAYGDAVKLYTMHEYWLVCPMHILFKDDREACVTPNCVACTLRHRRPPQVWRYTGLVQQSVRHVDAFLASSAFVGDMHAARGLDLPTVHLPLFAPPARPPRPGAPHPNGGRPYVLFVGRLERLKGLQDVIPAFGGPGTADLLIAGAGTFRADLERLAAGMERVRFLGPQPFDALGPLYRHAVALVTASLCYETFGQVVMEAFAYSTPVVSRRIGALGELVEASGGGRVFDTPGEMADALADLEGAPALRRRLGERGHAYYLDHGTVDGHLERYLAIVDELMQKRQRHG